MKFKIIFSIAVIGCLYYFFRTPKKTFSVTPYKVGMMSGWAPFMTINASGHMEGFDVDIVHEIEKRINHPITIIDCGSLTSLFVSLEKNKIDAIMSGLDITTKRKDAYDYVTYITTPLKNVVCISNKKISSVHELAQTNSTIAFEGGVSWEGMFDEYNIKNKIYLPSIADMLLHCNTGKVDAIVTDETQYHRIKDMLKDQEVIILPIEKNFLIEGTGVFFRKNDSLKAIFANALESMLADGTVDALIQKWGLRD
jgi:ABC-type amino acid transport substrate-binding protein